MNWRALGASVAGTLHVENQRGCDDAHGWTIDPGLAVLAVADGAGSRPGTSMIGAHRAVARVLQSASQPSFRTSYARDPRAAATGLVQGAITALEEEAGSRGTTVGALATTLCVALLSAANTTTIAQIGDGVAVVERASGVIETVAIAERFEYANETVFLSAPDALEHLKLFCATEDPVHSVALSTDGLRYKMLDDLQATRPYDPFFRDSWAYARTEDPSSTAIEKFLQEVDDQTGDDKTLVLAVRDFAGVPGQAHQLSDLSAPVQPSSPQVLTTAPGAETAAQ